MTFSKTKKPKLETVSNKSKTTYIKEGFLEMLETFIVSFLVLVVIQWLVAIPEYVEGPSMEPTIYAKERVLVEKVTKGFKDFDRGVIVVIDPPNDIIPYIKRVVGVPGDVVKVLDCGVYISNETGKFKLEEPYLYENTCTEAGSQLREGRSIRLEEDEYIVFGDNRTRSRDSRNFGKIKKEDIIGEVVVRFWPLNRVKVF